MGQLKRLFLVTLLLTFVAGLGAGSWVGSLLAAGEAAPPVDRRLQDFQKAFPDLSPTQVRELGAVLKRYDAEARRINRRTAEQARQIRELEETSVDRILGILTPAQREEYDRLRGRK